MGRVLSVARVFARLWFSLAAFVVMSGLAMWSFQPGLLGGRWSPYAWAASIICGLILAGGAWVWTAPARGGRYNG